MFLFLWSAVHLRKYGKYKVRFWLWYCVLLVYGEKIPNISDNIHDTLSLDKYVFDCMCVFFFCIFSLIL